MMMIRSVGLILSALCMYSQSAYALPAEQALEARIDALVSPYLKAGMFNGVVLVAEGKEILFQKGYGNANQEFGIPNKRSTKFRIASLSKQFTNAAIGVLIDRDIINPQSKLSEFLPDFPRSDEITVEHFVGHSSGVPHTNELEELKHVTRMSLPEMIDLLASRPLDFDPGTKDRYSNGGYDLLAAIIERASGVGFETFLKENVLEPLGLQNTGRLHTYEIVPGLAEGYLPGTVSGGLSHARFYPSEIRIGGGSLYSNAEDVYRLFRATFQREFASKKAGNMLFWDSTKRYEITGRAPGFVAKVFIDIPNDITIVSLANNYSFLVNWGRRLYQAAINEPWESVSLDWVDKTLDHDAAVRFTGNYASKWDNGSISLGPRGQLLFEDKQNDWRVALLPLGDGRFLHPFFDLTCRFSGEDKADSLICLPVLMRIEEETIFLRVEE